MLLGMEFGKQEKYKLFENFQEIQEKAARFNTLTDDEKIAVNIAMGAYNATFNKAVNEELEKDVTVDITPISAEAFDQFVVSNDLDLETIMTVQDVIVEG